MNRKRSSRGIEPIVSTLLLIVIVVFSFSFIYAYYNGWISFQTSGPLQTMQERLVIETIWIISYSRAYLYVFNTGPVAISIVEVDVNGDELLASNNGIKCEWNDEGQLFDPSTHLLTASSHGWIVVYYDSLLPPKAFTEGENYVFKVFTKGGNHFEKAQICYKI